MRSLGNVKKGKWKLQLVNGVCCEIADPSGGFICSF